MERLPDTYSKRIRERSRIKKENNLGNTVDIFGIIKGVEKTQTYIKKVSDINFKDFDINRGGCVPFSRYEGRIKYCMGIDKNFGSITDFSGKIYYSDKNIKITSLRETYEESLSVFNFGVEKSYIDRKPLKDILSVREKTTNNIQKGYHFLSIDTSITNLTKDVGDLEDVEDETEEILENEDINSNYSTNYYISNEDIDDCYAIYNNKSMTILIDLDKIFGDNIDHIKNIHESFGGRLELFKDKYTEVIKVIWIDQEYLEEICKNNTYINMYIKTRLLFLDILERISIYI